MYRLFLMLLLPILVLIPASGADDKKDQPDDKGFVPFFDGKTLNGWHVSPDGKTLASIGPETIRLWNVPFPWRP